MDADRQARDIKGLDRRNTALGRLLAMATLSVLLCLLVISRILFTERTVVVPPNINKTFWVTSDHGDESYLRQMGGYVAWLILDVSPASVDWKKDVLLDWVAPEDYDAMKARMNVQGERLRRINGASSFDVKQYAVSEAQQSVVLTGRLRRQINGEEVGTPELKSYRALFKFTGGRAHLKSFEEILYGPNGQVRVVAADGGADAR